MYGDLPQAGINDMVVLPSNENVLFAATDIGVYYTINGGTNWLRLGNNMPTMVIWDLEYNPTSQKLIAGTYARGLQTIDVNSLLASVGVKQVSNNKTNIILYPNPTHNYLTIKTGTNQKLNSVIVVDQIGKHLLNSSNSVLNVQSLSSGIYYAIITTDEGTITKRFIKN